MRQQKVIPAIIFIGVMLICGSSQLVRSQSGMNSRSLNFEHTKITGVVKDAEGNNISGIRIEVELAEQKELEQNLNLAGAQLDEAVQSLKSSVGNGIFTTVKTDGNGIYTIKGVPIPGVYNLFIRNDNDFLPTSLKLILSSADKKEFKAPPIVLRKRKGPALSPKAVKEIEKSRKAMEKKNLSKAIKHMKAALKIESKYAEGHYNLGILYLNAKKPKDAVKSLEQAVALKADYIPALEILGDHYLHKKEYNKAADFSTKLIDAKEKEGKLTAEDAKVVFRAGNCYKALKQMDKALPYFEKYLDMHKKSGKSDMRDALIYNELAGWYYQQKKIDVAIKFYGDAIKINPDIGADTYLYLANSYLYKKDGKNALNFYNQYMKRYPKGKNIGQVKAMVDRLKKMYPEK